MVILAGGTQDGRTAKRTVKTHLQTTWAPPSTGPSGQSPTLSPLITTAHHVQPSDPNKLMLPLFLSAVKIHFVSPFPFDSAGNGLFRSTQNVGLRVKVSGQQTV